MHLSNPHAWCLAVAMAPSLCAAQSLQEAVWMALAHYPSLAAAEAKTQAAQADIIRAKGAHWPQLSWSGTYSDYRHNGLPNRWTQTPVLSLNLWSGRRIQSDVERAQALAKASQMQAFITRDDVALLASEAYLQWAHYKLMMALALDNLVAHEKILRDFRTITQVDPGRRIDLNQAQVRYDNAQLVLLRNETDMRVAAERLSRMLMAPAPPEPSGLDFSPPMTYETLAQAQAQLNDSHPVIAQLLAQREAALASVRYAQAQNAPTVNLTHAKSTTPGLAEGQFVTQLQLNLPLFDGSTTRGAVAAATANVQALEADLIETRLVLNEQLSGAWTSWVSSQNRAEMGLEQTRTAHSLAYGYEQQFRVGRRSLLDLLNIQSDLFTYQTNAATAMHEARLSQARILASLGQLAQAYAQGSSVAALPASTPQSTPQPAAALLLVQRPSLPAAVSWVPVQDQDQNPAHATPTPAE